MDTNFTKCGVTKIEELSTYLENYFDREIPYGKSVDSCDIISAIKEYEINFDVIVSVTSKKREHKNKCI